MTHCLGRCAQVVSGAEQAAAAEAGAGGELLGAFNVATFAGEVDSCHIHIAMALPSKRKKSQILTSCGRSKLVRQAFK